LIQRHSYTKEISSTFPVLIVSFYFFVVFAIGIYSLSYRVILTMPTQSQIIV